MLFFNRSVKGVNIAEKKTEERVCNVCGYIHEEMQHWVVNWKLYFERAPESQLLHFEGGEPKCANSKNG